MQLKMEVAGSACVLCVVRAVCLLCIVGVARCLLLCVVSIVRCLLCARIVFVVKHQKGKNESCNKLKT